MVPRASAASVYRSEASNAVTSHSVCFISAAPNLLLPEHGPVLMAGRRHAAQVGCRSEDTDIHIVGIERSVDRQAGRVTVRWRAELEIYWPVLKLRGQELAINRRTVCRVDSPRSIAIIDAGIGPLLAEPPVLVAQLAIEDDVHPAVG